MICESYYNRHKIPVPIVRHIDCGILFFKSKDFPFWKIFTIYKQDALTSLFDYMIFEDEVEKRNQLELVLPASLNTVIVRQEEISWDKYESFLINFKKNFGLDSFDVMKSQIEIDLFAWEVFVYCHEKFLIKEFLHLEKWLFASINPKNTSDVRYDNYETFLRECWKFKNVGVFSEYWNSFYKRYTGKNYSRWLAELISNV